MSHTKDKGRVRDILENRHKSTGNSVTGTCILNDSEPPYLYSTTMKKSDSKCTRLYNPQGSHKTTMVYSKLLEDSAVRPNKYKVWCEQCNSHHPVHNQDDMQIIFVTKDPELAKGTKSHMADQRDTSFRDRLLKGGVPTSQTVHIEFVDMRDGGAFADNLTRITAMIARECNCPCFVF